jgi:hypothetical protein
MERLGAIVARLDGIVEELDDISFDLLREASSMGATTRPPADKKLTQARRAVEKASHLLQQLQE